MELYNFQKSVARHLRAGQNVILQAPTGSGKTIAALWPFLEAWDRQTPDFPRQCIYSVPMRVLANQFTEETERLIREDMVLKKNPEIRIHTGEQPEDPEFASDLIFTTIDQTLSNVLGVPYAVGKSRANLNAGAVIGSYLVFDEFHLYPHDSALKTTLQILKLLKDVTPFVLMTATFSSAMLEELKAELGAEVVTVPPEELAKIPSQQNKERRYHVADGLLTAEAVLQHHRTRSIAICNTVDRAQELFKQLRDHPNRGDAQVILLHARFTASDRKRKEEFIRTEFGKKMGKWSRKSVILVATQVIEVGLDITCENLHTEIAPANAIFQRAGRCARFEDQKGDVYIYNVPVNKNNEPNYAPYTGTEAKLCSLAWEAFAKRNGAALNFHGEQEVIDEVHTEADRNLLRSMRENEGEIWNLIQRAMVLGETSTRRDLIRDSSASRTLLAHGNPNEMENPFKYRGFSIFLGSLLGKYEELEQWAQERELDWLFKFPQEAEDLEEEDARARIKYLWHGIRGKDDLKYFPLLVVNPALVKYDKELGFRFSPTGDADPSALNEPVTRSKPKGSFDYQLEDYPTHIQKMIRVFEREWRERLQFAAARLEQKQGWPQGSIERAARLAIALHDVGKMDVRWQKWAREYQKAIGEPVADPNFMVAHTHSENEEHRRTAKGIRLKRPHHAGEGAVATAKLIYDFFNQSHEARQALWKVVLTAIVRHHSAQADSFDDSYRLVPDAAPSAILAALQNAGLEVGPALAEAIYLTAPKTTLENRILSGSDEGAWWLVYFLVVRTLRMCDGESQEE